MSRPPKCHHVHHFHHKNFLPVRIVSIPQERSRGRRRAEPPLGSPSTARPRRASGNCSGVALTPAGDRRCQTLNAVHRDEEFRCAPTSSPGLLAQRGDRGRARASCGGGEVGWRAARGGCVMKGGGRAEDGGACCTDCLCSTERDRKSRSSRR